jgi:hypothetical protein
MSVVGGNPMDPVSLSSAAVALLVPYLQRLGGKMTDKASEQLAEAALPALGRLYQAMKRRLVPGTYAGGQLAGVEEHPERKGRQQALVSTLAEMLEDDVGFVTELAELVTEAQAAVGVQTKFGRVEGPVAIGGDVHQHGHYVAGHDLTVATEEHRGRTP